MISFSSDQHRFLSNLIQYFSMLQNKTIGLQNKSDDHYGLKRKNPFPSNYQSRRLTQKQAIYKTQLNKFGWFATFSLLPPNLLKEEKTFFNDYQLVTHKSDLGFLRRKRILNRESGQIKSYKVIRYRRTNTNIQKNNSLIKIKAKPRGFSVSNNSSFKRPFSRGPENQTNQIKNPSHTISTRSASKNHFLKEFSESTASQKVNFAVSHRNIMTQCREEKKGSVIREQIESEGNGSGMKSQKISSKVSSQQGKIKMNYSKKNSFLLSINSKRSSQTFGNESWQLQGYMLIDTHLEDLNNLAQYSQGIIESYEDISEWDELIFLVYKKFYLERKKFISALRFKQYDFFCEEAERMNKNQIIAFINSSDCRDLRKDLEKENIKILESLRNLYNLAIEKSGEYVNMIEKDNFSMAIFRLMKEELNQLKYLFDFNREEVIVRVRSTLACAATLCKLNQCGQQFLELKKFTNIQITKSFFPKIILFFQTQF